MGTMNVSLPDTLKSCVDVRVAAGGHGTSSVYIRDLIRADWDRQRRRALLLDGAASPPTGLADAAYFDGLRDSVPRAKAG